MTPPCTAATFFLPARFVVCVLGGGVESAFACLLACLLLLLPDEVREANAAVRWVDFLESVLLDARVTDGIAADPSVPARRRQTVHCAVYGCRFANSASVCIHWPQRRRTVLSLVFGARHHHRLLLLLLRLLLLLLLLCACFSHYCLCSLPVADGRMDGKSGQLAQWLV